VNPLEFLDELFIAKTRVLGLTVDEDFVILACVFFDTVPAYDEQTDRQTDNSTVANTRLCTASYADAL